MHGTLLNKQGLDQNVLGVTLGSSARTKAVTYLGNGEARIKTMTIKPTNKQRRHHERAQNERKKNTSDTGAHEIGDNQKVDRHQNTGVALLRRFRSQQKGGRVVTSGQFLKKGLPGRVDTSGTKTTIKTGNVDLPWRKIQNKEVDLIRRYMLCRGTNMVLEPWSVTRDVLCMDGMMTCQMQFVARVSHGMWWHICWHVLREDKMTKPMRLESRSKPTKSSRLATNRVRARYATSWRGVSMER